MKKVKPSIPEIKSEFCSFSQTGEVGIEQKLYNCFTCNMQAKSLYISRAVGIFYKTEIKIWTGFGPVGNAEKMGLLMSNF